MVPVLRKIRCTRGGLPGNLPAGRLSVYDIAESGQRKKRQRKTSVSKLEPGQYTPGNHYANQVNIWGGLGQLSLNLLEEKHSGTSASTYGLESESAEAAAYRYYDDVQLWIMDNYPNSLAAQTYRASAQALAEQGTENRAATYSGENGYYTYIYNPPAGYAWQIVAIVGEEISEGGGTDIPDVPDTEYYSANWTAPAQSASGSFDLTFTVNADKQQLETGEKVDGAKITVTPSKTSGSIDGGSWQMSPAGAQTITTTGHTNDDNYQNNGGDGTVSWTVHYEVSKTSTTTLSGQEGPFSSQAEADAAAEAAKNAAISQLKNEAQGMVDAAVAAARAELATIRFSYDEVEIPYGFEEFNGSLGSHQTITVPADSSNDYVMKNDEWSLQVNLKKVDSETGEQIAGDALYEVYEWDTVTQQYITICTITYAYRLFGYPVKIESKGLVQSWIDHEEEIYMEFPAGEKVSIRASIVDFKGLEKMKIQGSEGQIKVFLYHAGQKVVCRKGLFKKEQYKGKGATIGYMPEFDTVASEIREGLKESQVVPLQATSDLMHILDTIRAQIGLEYTNLE